MNTRDNMMRVELHCRTICGEKDGAISVNELIRHAIKNRVTAVAITNHASVSDFPRVCRMQQKYYNKGKFVKVIYGIEANIADDSTSAPPSVWPVFHATILISKEEGRKNLYALISDSATKYLDEGQRIIPKSELNKKREGLLVGSGCSKGEMYQAMLRGVDKQEIDNIAGFYDYLEVQPPKNDMKDVEGPERIKEIIRMITESGDRCGIPVVATGDVHSLHLQSTEGMLDAFSFLGEDKADEIVICNSNKIAEACDIIQPVADIVDSPVIPGSEKYKEGIDYDSAIEDADTPMVRELAWKAAHEMYGDVLPDFIEDRLAKELGCMIFQCSEKSFLIAAMIAEKSRELGYHMGYRGCLGASLIAYFLGITDVNPSKPHYHCPDCHHTDDRYIATRGICLDLVSRLCPDCKKPMEKIGFNIPYQTLFREDGGRALDMELTVAPEIYDEIITYLEEAFGKGNVCQSSTMVVSDDNANVWYKDPRIAKLIVLGKNVDINEITPVTGYDELSSLPVMEFRDTDLPRSTVRFGLICDSALSYPAAEHEQVSGRVSKIINEYDPQTFAGAFAACALAHDSGAWENNAQELLDSGEATLETVISTRDDVFNDIVREADISCIKGLDAYAGIEDYVDMEDVAASIMEVVFKGLPLTPDMKEIVRRSKLPEWYLRSLENIEFLFPKAHIIEGYAPYLKYRREHNEDKSFK
ncbi:PHP domain-containing protein [Aminicella lysinilytica]|uniref:DNA polymerase III alpha subunit n=1 Tax=Aminicella lysinilytica TaxID=433323 RepID=A0A4R6QCP2_9FIRM|nr:PHP domain-containing protein [Aminicella lysinilytica]TDP60554.1 DNA polymerase III alpha subunit [Aminicella lysinilytica]